MIRTKAKNLEEISTMCNLKTKVDNNGISCRFDNDSLLLRLSIMLRPTPTKLGAITSLRCDNIYRDNISAKFAGHQISQLCVDDDGGQL